MHELGVTFHIADYVMDIAKQNEAGHVLSVVLELGEVSTVIPDYLTDCWNWNAKRYPILSGCELVIERIPAVTHCDGCGQDYPTVQYGKTCPHCRSTDTWLLAGNEVNIKEISVE